MVNKGTMTTEYLMTYGWALLAIVIVAGVLWGAGLFTPIVDEKQSEDYITHQDLDIAFSQESVFDGNWTVECVEREIKQTERYLVDEKGVVGIEFTFNPDEWGSPLLDNTSKLMESWNETICTKSILVKYN
ncbi:MAG: hypothetical protein KAT05_00795 [Spirochaetes bacterium]|nr:hypothetical protein [Spirochaetota bacterium]